MPVTKYTHTGSVQPVPTGIVRLGPCIDCMVTHGRVDQARLIAAGEVAEQVVVKFMVDTGAQCTVIDDEIPQQLKLAPIRTTQIIGVSRIPEDYPVYRMAIGLKMASDLGHEILVTFEADLVGMRSGALHQGLIGRDFLKHFQALYDGPAGTIQIIHRVTVDTPPPRPPGKPGDKRRRR